MAMRRATGCARLSLVISPQIQSLNLRRSMKSRKIHKKTIFLDFKVVQGHRCWYVQKGC